MICRPNLLANALALLVIVGSSAFAGVQQGVQFDGKFYSWPGFDDPLEASYITTITCDITTPHIPTALPYHLGRTRVLFICPRYSARPTVELCQRFDIEEKHSLVARRRDLTHLPREDFFGSPGDKLEEVRETLLDGLAWKPDVIVIYDFAWSLLPADVLARIADMANSGVGMVFWNLEEGNALPKSMSSFVADAEAAASILSCIPEESRYCFDMLKAFSSPQAGRVAAFSTQAAKGMFSYLDDEDSYAVAGRAMLWAAKREPATRLDVTIEPGALRADSRGDKLPGLTADIAVYDPTAVLRHELETSARIRLGQVWKFPHLKAGQHWARVTLRRGKTVVDWRTLIVNVSAPVGVEKITFVREHEPQDGTVRAKVSLSGEGLDDYELEYRLMDTYDRIVGEGKAKPAREVGISAPVRDCLSPMCFMVVALTRNGRTVAENRAWFTVAQPPVDADDFHAMPWPSGGTGSIWQNSLTTMQKQMGINFAMTDGSPLSERLWPKPVLNVRPYVYAINHGNQAGAAQVNGGPARVPCLTSEEYSRESDRLLTQHTENSVRFSPMGYTDCGDARLHRDGTDVCFSDTCLQHFREYLKTRYHSLDDLNTSWETGYRDWAEIVPITLAELEAWKTDSSKPEPSPGQYARWVEHRMHMESVWAGRHKRDQEVIQAVDPGARVGLDALCDYGGSFGGFDFSKMLSFMGVLGPYANEYTLQVARSLARPDTMLGCWVGGGYPHYRTPQYASATAWWLLFGGFNMQLFFAEYAGSGDLCPMFAPDLRPFPVMAEQAKQLREVQSGIGKLLLSARRENDGIAFLYSPASVHAATLTRGMPLAEFAAAPGIDAPPSDVFSSPWVEYVAANEAMSRIFTDLGFQYDYVTPEQVARGRLREQGFRVLVLPYAQAFSSEVSEAIRRFTASGGVVLADLRPGIFDGHGRLLGRGQLDDLFGIKRSSGFPEPLKSQVPVLAAGNGKLPEMPVDHQVKATSARSLAQAGEAPVLLSNQYEKGQAILLNFYPRRYVALRTKGAQQPLLQPIRAILEAAGIRPRAQANADGTEVPVTEIVRFTHGNNEYVGILRDHRMFYSEPVPILNQAPCKAEVDFGRTAHVYDSRAGRYLGRRRKISTTIVTAEAQLYALLPYRVKSVRAVETTQGVGNVKSFSLQVTTDTDKPGTHVLHVEVKDAKGHARPEYSQNVMIENGTGTYRLPLALSDPAGEWKLTARDAATAIAGQTRFRVQSR